MNKIKLDLFYSLYKNYFFEYKCDLFIYFKNIFYHFTLQNIFRILNNSVYFHNIVACNEPFIVMHTGIPENWDRGPIGTLAGPRKIRKSEP